MSVQLLEIPLSQIAEAVWNPRKHYDEAALNDLAASVREKGVLEPAIVRSRVDLPGCFELVAGHRRYRAASRAQLETLPCLVRDLTDAEALEIAVVENSQRADVHPIEEAEAIERLMLMDAAYTTEAVAAKLGVHVTTVNRKLRLLRLIDVVREAYAANAITAAHAERLAKLSPDQQPKALAECFRQLLAFEDDADDVVDDNRSSVERLIDLRAWDRLANAVAPVGELDNWLNLFGKADLTDDGAKQQVLEALSDEDVADLSDQAQNGTNVIGALTQLSELDGFEFSHHTAEIAGVLHCDHWREIAADQTPCKHAKKGVVVHGGPLRVVTFCQATKKCAQHWPQLQPKSRTARATDDQVGPPAAKPQWQIDQEKRDAAQAAWQEQLGPARKALAAHVVSVKFSAALVRHVLGIQKIAIIKREFGIELTEKTAAVVLALSGVQDWRRDSFIETTKPLGFNLAKFEQAQKAEAKKAKAAKPTPAKAAPKKASKKPAKATKKGGR
jgi:ParB/RepB/Spo0J family partition protein